MVLAGAAKAARDAKLARIAREAEEDKVSRAQVEKLGKIQKRNILRRGHLSRQQSLAMVREVGAKMRQMFTKKVRVPRKPGCSPSEPKLIKIPKKATVNRLGEIEEKNAKKIKVYQEKVENCARKTILAQDKAQAKEREKVNKQLEIASQIEKLASAMKPEDGFCSHATAFRKMCILERKLNRGINPVKHRRAPRPSGKRKFLPE